MSDGANIISKKLIDNNCTVIFEYPGGNVAPMLDALKLEGKLDLIVTRNDQAASLMADAYARTTGKVGVCMATVGPGATNLITGIANAFFDSIPIIAITGQVGTNSLKGNKKTRQIGFQEVDIIAMTKPITKWSYMLTKSEEIEWVFDEAFKIAIEGRPGPVLIDIPMDIQRNLIEKIGIVEIKKEIKKTDNINDEKIDLVLKKLTTAKRPVIIAGGGVILSNAENELKILAEKLEIPIANTLMGLGSFDLKNKLALGFMGCYGSRYCNKVIAESDLIIALGNRFDIKAIGTEVGSFKKNKFIIHVDIDKSEIDNRIISDLSINDDIKKILQLIINKSDEFDVNRKEWLDNITKFKKIFNLEKEYNLAKEYDKVRPQYIIKEISDLTNGNAIITSDVGQHQMWVAQFYEYRKTRTNLTSGGLGNMGYGLPAAIAAKYAKKDMQVINITGDGSFQMNLQELGTSVEYHLPIKIFLLKNNTLGLVKQFQDKTFSGKATSTVIGYNLDFIKLAEAYGIKGLRISEASKIKEIVKEALEYDGSVLVECSIDSQELAIPEIEGGHYLDDQYPYEFK